MYCKFCGKQIDDDSSFCVYCGKSLENNRKDTNTSDDSYKNANNGQADQEMNFDIKKAGSDIKNLFSNIASKVTEVAGMEIPKELKLRDVFSDVLKKHTDEEAERLFIMGTAQTTPNIENAIDSWPKPWLFARIFIIIMICYFGLYLGLDIFKNINFLPGLIIMGSFMMPISLLVFFWEMNTPQNISIYEIVRILFIGGVISLIITVFLDSFLGEGSASAIIIGIVEETAKLLPIIWILKNRKYKYILNGLLIGAAIGAGFAAFESAGYALNMGLHYGVEAVYSTIFTRSILAPGGHIVWAGLSGAALYMVKGEKQFQWEMLREIRFLRIFIIVMVMHALWDMGFTASFLSVPLHMIILTIVSWIIVFAMISAGLKEISSLKEG